MAVALLISGALAATATTCALFRIRHPAAISVLVMFAGWLAGELALFHLVAQVVATAVLVALGALDDGAGRIGLALMVYSWVGLVVVQATAGRARTTLADALEPNHADASARVRAGSTEPGPILRPFSHPKAGIEVIRNVEYGPYERNRLDIYRPSDDQGVARPVVVYVHGGAWMSGDKKQQALPLLHALARAGWIGVTPNHRLGPKHRLPASLDDVESAIAWVREHVAEYGGDPTFIGLVGNSAGGHLASLVALRHASPPVQACVPIYAPFDLTDHLGIRGYARMTGFLQRMVMPSRLDDDRDFWEQMSPIFLDGAEAPPFLVIQGSHDVFVWREEARAFVERLRQRSSDTVAYAELPGAQHAFDLFHSRRSQAAVEAVVAFLESVRARGGVG